MRFPCKLPISFIHHSRGEIFPRPWEEATTTVERSYHGRGEL